MLDLLFPPTCPACGAPGRTLCEPCWRQLRPAPPRPAPSGVELCRSLLLYEGAGRELVARIKYRNARSVVGWLGAGMATLIGPHLPSGTLVTWVPTSPSRRRDRGFDQAELLARATAKHLRLRVAPLLRRANDEPQTGRPAAARLDGVQYTARARRTAGPVLLVDDVITTGGTLAAASAAIVNAASTNVFAVTAASTPLKVAIGGTEG